MPRTLLPKREAVSTFNVERENRRVRWAGIAAALSLAFSLLTGATTPPTELDVSRLRILDGDGKVRAALAVSEDGPGLILVGANGKIRAALGVDKDGPNLFLYDTNGKVTMAALGVTTEGATLTLDDANGTPRAGLVVTKDGPGLALSDANEKPRAALLVSKAGPMLLLNDANGKPIWSAPFPGSMARPISPIRESRASWRRKCAPPRS
jgi:hypothetical protein